MNRCKISLAVATVFAIGAAFSAQPTAVHKGGDLSHAQQRDLWVPGTNMVMSAHENDLASLAPPR